MHMIECVILCHSNKLAHANTHTRTCTQTHLAERPDFDLAVLLRR